MDFKGNFNHCIIIRSFLSKNYDYRYISTSLIDDAGGASRIYKIMIDRA